MMKHLEFYAIVLFFLFNCRLTQPIKENAKIGLSLPTPEVRVVKAKLPSPTLVVEVPTKSVEVRSIVPVTYTVEVNDTVSEIANKLGITPDVLAVANGITNPDLIKPGEVLAIPNPEAKPVPIINKGKVIEVDLANQRLYTFENGKLLKTFIVSTGLPETPTPRGEFRIWIKLLYDNMSGGQGARTYNLKNVPYVMYFQNDKVSKSEGYSLHGTYWHHNFGIPMSHGCVNLKIEDAKELFDWAEIETTLIIIF